jgi:hypothetical protein
MLLLFVGTVNILYGIGAISDAKVFVGDTRYIFTNLHTMGWVLVLLGLIQLTGGFSLLSGHAWGRIIGMTAGMLGALGALLSIGGNDPWWSLAVFALCIYIVHGIAVYGEDADVATAQRDRVARP